MHKNILSIEKTVSLSTSTTPIHKQQNMENSKTAVLLIVDMPMKSAILLIASIVCYPTNEATKGQMHVNAWIYEQWYFMYISI